MANRISELDDGRVVVEIRSKRGTGTRDEDTVSVSAVFRDVEEAEAESDRLNRLVRRRMEDAREVSHSPDETEGGGSDPESGGVSEGTRTEDDEASGDGPAESEGPKIYLGKGSQFSGWIPLPREVIFERIAPLVSNNVVDEDDPHVKVNFTSDVPASGWKRVAEDVVHDRIEEIVRRQRLDQRSEPNDGRTDGALIRCPGIDCGYEGSINQVIGHVKARTDQAHRDLPTTDCPVDGCSYSNSVDSVLSHVFSNRDGTHDSDVLVEDPNFEKVE